MGDVGAVVHAWERANVTWNHGCPAAALVRVCARQGVNYVPIARARRGLIEHQCEARRAEALLRKHASSVTAAVRELLRDEHVKAALNN